MISEKRGAFWNPKNLRFHRNRGSFKVKVSDFFNMENTDGLHKFPVSGGTGPSYLSHMSLSCRMLNMMLINGRVALSDFSI